MSATNRHHDPAADAAIRDLLARTPPAPRDPLRARILQIATGPEAMLAALQFALAGGRKRHRA